jgi:hypothetical protein
MPAAVVSPITASAKMGVHAGRDVVNNFLKRLGYLGFDTPGEARGAILNDPNWAQTFDLSQEPRHVMDALSSWRQSALADRFKRTGTQGPAPSEWDIVRQMLIQRMEGKR